MNTYVTLTFLCNSKIVDCSGYNTFCLNFSIIRLVLIPSLSESYLICVNINLLNK